MPITAKRGNERAHARSANRFVVRYTWTLDGRETIVDHRAYIVRSCPRCRAERSASAEDIPALDELREWAFGHSAYCVANDMRIAGHGPVQASIRSRNKMGRSTSGLPVEAFA